MSEAARRGEGAPALGGVLQAPGWGTQLPLARPGARLEQLSWGLQYLALPVLLLLVWHLVPTLGLIPTTILPPPATVLRTLADLWASGELLNHLQISLWRVVQGLAIGGVMGLAMGLAMGVSRRAETLLMPTFRAFCQVPTLAWLPLLMMMFGIGEALKIIILTKTVLVPMCISTFEGVRGVPERYLEVARVLRLRRRTALTQLLLPAVIPSVFGGVRQGLGQAWVALVGVELLASAEGIGYMMQWGRIIFQLDVVLAGVLVVGAVGLLMDLVMRRIERGLGGRSSETEVGAVVPRGAFSWRLSLVLPLGLALLWTLSVELAWVDARLLPPIERVLLAGFDPVVLKLVVEGLGATLWRNLEGALLGCLAGLLFGALLGASPLAQRLFGPGFHVFRQIAMFAWIPLLTAWFGIGETMRVLFIAIAAFKPMAVNTQIGVSHVQQQYLEVGRSMQLRGWRLVRKVVLPAALPTIVTGLQLAFISSWLATVGVETLVSFTVGIGSVLREGEEHFHMHVVMFGIVLIGCMGFLFNVALNQASRRLLAWREVRG